MIISEMACNADVHVTDVGGSEFGVIGGVGGNSFGDSWRSRDVLAIATAGTGGTG